MIVKNEAHVIKRALDSVKDFIDYWVIVDTGSTDDTKKIIQETMRGIAGELVDVPWKNFGFNRSESLRIAKDKSDYSLILDADEFMVFKEGFDKDEFKESLDLDLYYVTFRLGSTIYKRSVLTKNSLGWSYKGVLHEFPISVETVNSRGDVDGFLQTTHSDGFRNQNTDKYAQDARLIEEALVSETDPFLIRRYTFYLAQSYRDSHQDQLSYETYLKRATLGGWNEEISVSFFIAGELAIKLNKTQEEVLSLFSKSFGATPWRAEAVHAAVRYLRLKDQFGLAYLLAKSALDIPAPDNSLFVKTWVYEYSLLDEFAVCAFYIGKFGECRDACLKLLSSGKLPSDSIGRVEKNIEFCKGKF